MTAFGKTLKIIGGAVFAITGLWGFVLCLAIISKAAGFWGLLVSLIVGPITFVAAPLYAGFSWHDWFPLMLNYGGSIAAGILFSIGRAISGDN